MTNYVSKKPGPIEVWLSQENMQVKCRIVHEDESTSEGEGFGTDSLSMRGAQREWTGYLIGEGYVPAGRWETEAASDGDTIECVRQFRPGNDAGP